MGISWTEKQEQVITSRNRNLLVSAAAGSGKTAVLVERIIRMITEGEHPLDIDRLLVMTFTNAAAAEMRERVAAAIEKRLEEDPDNEHLQMQATLVQQAQITTIDSFCLSVIRNHFDALDIDPAFRIGDEGELMLLRGEVLEKLLEDCYEEGRKEFSDFVETYASGKGDYGIGDVILQVYTFSQSNPWPEEWFARCRRELEEDCVLEGSSGWQESRWMEFLMADIRSQLEELSWQLEEAVEVCGEADGPEAYLPVMEENLEHLRRLREAEDYHALKRLLENCDFGRLKAIRGGDVSPEKKKYASDLRDRAKKAVQKIRESYFSVTEEELTAAMVQAAPAAREVLWLAEEFSRRYQEQKREKDIVDFNDLEHFALQVLSKDGEPSDAAKMLADRFEEILVDEYQDSNEVQETLIRLISRERLGRPNVFMVGDVKQSIYRFRLAKPELFLEKYDSYPETEGLYQKIELHQNFRSRARVLESVNHVFFQIMTKALGGIRYTEETALHPGASFLEIPEELSGKRPGKTELLLLDVNEELLKGIDEEYADYTARELEARLVAAKIREMTDRETGLIVWDKEEGRYRRARYGDMVILLRSTAGWAEVFVSVLMNEGIPAHADSKTGYFNTLEVETVLSLLSVLDNPMQDIPLAAVMKSPIGGFSDRELAELVSAFKKTAKKGQDGGLYGAWRSYLNRKPGKRDEALWSRLVEFDGLVEELREKSRYLTIRELLWQILGRTGYYDYVTAMPGGDVRRANLDMLVEKAAAYEKTSYRGLFHFVAYIRNLKKYNTDFGEASTAGEHDDTVRVMSIHRSKGLEFPVVFLSGLGKAFNKQDVRGKLLLDSDLGIGTDCVDLELRTRKPTLKKNVLKRKMDLDAMGEELRILYVAMSRAKEQLVMTAADKGLEKKLEKWSSVPRQGRGLPFTVLSSAGSYLDWVLMSLAEGGDSILVSQIPAGELLGREMIQQAERAASREELLHFDGDTEYDETFGEEIARSFSFRYPYRADIGLHTKMTVSELKQQGQMTDEAESQFVPTRPAFLSRDQEERRGAFRGTAYHRVLELLDFRKMDGPEQVAAEMDRLVSDGHLPEEYRKLVDPRTLWQFFDSPLGRRMRNAALAGKLHKEQQFVIGVPARELEAADSDELVLIQGIIDAYLEETDGLILIDYKTDYLERGQEQRLKDRYGVQLDYYERALNQMTGQKVKEKMIYSMTLQEEIRL